MGEGREPVGTSVLSRGDAEYSEYGFRDYAPTRSRRIPVGWRRYRQDDWFALNAIAGKARDKASDTGDAGTGAAHNGEILGGRR